MAGVPPVVRRNPVPVVLSVAALVVGLATVGLALAGSDAALLIRLSALTVVLAAFAGGFWMGVVGERMG